MSNLMDYRQGGRGSGRTTRLIKVLPDGGIYITHSYGFSMVLRRYLAQLGRASSAITFCVPDDTHMLRGRKGPVAVDHYLFESLNTREIQEMYSNIGPVATMIFTNDFEGDVITTRCIDIKLPEKWLPVQLVEPTVMDKFTRLFSWRRK